MSDGSLLFDTKLDTSGLKSGLGSIGSVATSVMGGAVAAVGAASAGVVAFGKTAVDAGMNFDSSMSQVAATMGTTVDQIGDLRSFAQEMGATTAFSASQAADALNYMALAGYDANTSMEMLPNVLNLAAAGGIELAEASDMVTDAQSAFGLSVDQTKTMVDQMALTSSKTNTSVAQLGEAFLTVGANAKNLSGGTAELSQVLGLLADNGIKGAEGGTHLRNIMLAMNPTTDQAAAAWDALGVSAYDADGNLRPLQDTFGDLKAAMAGMTDQEKTQTLTAMFNKTDLASINALLATDADRWGQVAGAIADCEGASQAMADTQLDNLSGDITLFQSALEGAQIAVSDGLTPTLREFVQFGSDGLSKLTTAMQEGGFQGALDALGPILQDGLNMITGMLPSILQVATQILNSLIAVLPGLISTLIPPLMTSAIQVIQAISGVLPQVVDAIMAVLPQVISAVVQAAPSILSTVAQLIAQVASQLGSMLPTLLPEIINCVVSIGQTLIENLPLLIQAACELFLGLVQGIIQAMPQIIAALPALVNSIVGALIQCMPMIIECGVQLFIALIQNLPAIISAIIQAAPQIVSALVRGFLALRNQFKGVGTKMMTKLKDGLTGMLSSAVATVKDIGKNIVDGLWSGISSAWSWITDKVSGLASGLFDTAKSALGIHSPSKKFRWIGEMCVAGFDEGIEGLMDGSALGDAVNASLGTVRANVLGGESAIGAGGQLGARQTFNFYDTQTSPDAIRRKVQNTMTFGLAGGI